MTKQQLSELSRRIEYFAIKFPIHERIGELFLDEDTNIVYVISTDGQRFLTGAEYVELMNPTQNCAQLHAQNELEKLKPLV